MLPYSTVVSVSVSHEVKPRTPRCKKDDYYGMGSITVDIIRGHLYNAILWSQCKYFGYYGNTIMYTCVLYMYMYKMYKISD